MNRPVEETTAAKLGAWDAASIIVGIVIGTTIFEASRLIFGSVPNPWSGLAVWAFGGFLALVGGLCYAELGATYPRAGGDYYYLTEGFGRFTGFLFGWAQLIVILPASIGIMAVVFAIHATGLKPLPDFANLGLDSEFYYAAIAVLAITFLNLLGVTLGKTAQNVLTAAKTLGLLAILVCGLFLATPDVPTDWTLPETLGDWAWGSLAIILVLYAFGGWNDVSFVAAEVRNPQRNIPRALLIGISFITLIYLLVNLSYLVGLGFDNARTETPDKLNLPARLLDKVMGANGVTAIRVIIMVSALGAVNGLVFAGSRVYATL